MSNGQDGKLNPAALWERLVAQGMSKDEATQQVEKAIQWEKDNTKPSPLKRAAQIFGAVTDPLGTAMRVARHTPEIIPQTGRGLAESGLATAAGAAELVGAEEAARGVRRYREYAREVYGEPETGYGVAAQVGARLIGDVAQFMAPGTALGKVGGLVGATRLAKPASWWGRVLREIGTGAPIDAAIAASGKEESVAGLGAEYGPKATQEFFEDVASDPHKRGAFEALVGSALAGPLAALPQAKRAARAVEAIEEPARREIPEVLGGTKEELLQREALQAVEGERDLREIRRQMAESKEARDRRTWERFGQFLREEDAKKLEAVRGEEAARVIPESEKPTPIPEVLGGTKEELLQREALQAVEGERDLRAARREMVEQREAGERRAWERLGQFERDEEAKSMLAVREQEIAEAPDPRLVEPTRQDPAYRGWSDDRLFRELTETTQKYERNLEVGFGPRAGRDLAAPKKEGLRRAGVARGNATKGQEKAARLTDELRARGFTGEAVQERLGMMTGAARADVVASLAGAGVGAAAGAAAEPEQPLVGAGAGAVAGAVGGAALARHLGRAKAAPAAAEAVTEAPRMVSDVPPKLGKKDFDVHIDRIRQDPDGRMEIGERASQLKEQGVLANRRVSWNETAEAARSVDVDKFLHERGNRALSGAEGLAVRNTYNENQAFLSRAYKDLERLSEDTPEYADLAQRVALMESRADALLQRFVRGASQQGRDFNALKILANQTTDPFVWLTKLQRVMGPGEMVTRDMRRKIVDLAEKGDRLGLANEVQKHRKPLTWRDTAYWTTLIRAGMLTLPVSVGRALFGNTGRAAYETMAQPGAVAADAIFSLITHKRAVTFGGFTGAKARLGGFVRGLKQSPAALRGDLLEETLDKFDTPINTRLAPIFGETAVADAFVRYVFGSQGAVDRPFREMAKSANLVEQARIVAYHGSLEEQAKEMARLGLPEGVSRAEFVDQMVRNPSAQMRVRAGVEALHEVFQNKTIASAAGTGIISGIRQVSPPAANIFQASVLPFVRTPSAVGTIGIESTPIGALGTVADLVRLWRGAAGDAVDEKALYELQRRASKRAGRWGTGILGVVMGYSLYASDRMTGPLPSSRSEREQWREAGKQPYSIRIGGRWHPVGQIQPLGAIVAFGSGLAHSDEAEHGPLRALFDLSAFGGATSAALRSLLDLPFISGVTDITRAIQEGADKPIGEQVGQFARRKAGSVIPNIVAGLARATDPVIREADTVWQALKARVPGASRTLPEKPGLFGETIVRERGKRNQVLYAFFNVTGSREAKAETMPVLAEIESVGFIVPALRGKQKDEPAEGYRQRKRMYGRLTELALEEAIQSETYQLLGPIAREYVRTDPRLADVPPGELADALRREMLGDAVSRARRELTAALREQQ